MILMIDNYDSFTYNLVDYLGKISSHSIEVYRHDEITLDDIDHKKPDYIVISPGPKRPADAGISKAVIRKFGPTIPLLGVCLGHQAIAEEFGGKIINAKNLMHGKTSLINHKEHPLFKGLSNPFVATRYHSLVVDPSCVPDSLDVIAHSDDDQEIMGLAHREYPIYGVQFHPESICSPEGIPLLKNFLNLSR
ncbi:anthranilate/aminodeoxychorismate synthase component II [Candidatus Marinamargulisbacteria bacterium SCGC AG-410-N11]|nr:anthranilate/aminodeoxychorismate synthase component II [Candidatus Marinamargulisbacteria bacterium SCGC AG-410-N11]